MSDPRLQRRFEMILAEASAGLFEGTDAKHSLLEVARVGSAVGLVDYSPAGRLNRVAGIGVGEPATEQMIDDWVTAYRSRGIQSFFFWVSPNAQPFELVIWLEAHGFVHDRSAARIARRAGEATTIETDLRVETADESDKTAVAEVLAAGFGMSRERGLIVAESISLPGWRWFVAWDGERPAGTGGLYVRDGIGWLGYGATAPEFRRRGAQGAIIAARVAEASRLGCEWVTSETAEDTPDAPVSSFHNLLRNGFELVHMMKGYAISAAQAASA